MTFPKGLDSVALEALEEIRHTIICQWTLQHDSSHGSWTPERAHFHKHCSLCPKTCKGDPSTIRLLYATRCSSGDSIHALFLLSERGSKQWRSKFVSYKDLCCWEYRTRNYRSLNPSLADAGNHKAGTLISEIYQQYLPPILPKPWFPPNILC